MPRLSQIYASVRIDDPREAATLVGPLIDRRAYESMQRALEEAREAGGIVHGGQRIAGIGGENAYYVRPALCEMPAQAGPVLRETFAPILYVMRYSKLGGTAAMVVRPLFETHQTSVAILWRYAARRALSHRGVIQRSSRNALQTEKTLQVLRLTWCSRKRRPKINGPPSVHCVEIVLPCQV